MQRYHLSHPSSPANPISLAELFGQIMGSSFITTTEQQQLLQALENHSLNDDETAMIRRLLYNIRRGWIKLVDDSIDWNRFFLQ